MSATPVDTVELIVFEVAGTKFASDAGQVLRIDKPSVALKLARPMLGQPRVGKKSLVHLDGAGQERGLIIDAVHGVVAAPVSSLRRLPEAAGVQAISLGAWINGQDTVLLVDLAAFEAAP